MKAKKHLGQHFLTSKAVLRTMLDAAAVTAEDTVLEIGPGKGVLTMALLETGARVVAIETDMDLLAVLEDTFAAEVASGQLALVHEDVRNVATQAHVHGAYKIVANIPYYITGEIIRRFLTSEHQPESMTLLVQKEVAERIARSAKETVLSLSVKAYGHPRYVKTVPARYFSPPPKVDSAVVHIGDISKRFFSEVREERFFKVVKAGFTSKRKMLVNNLAVCGGKARVAEVLTQLGLPENIRAEDVSLDEWQKIAITL